MSAFLKQVNVIFILVCANLALVGCSSGPDHTQGMNIVKSNCKVCHGQGINGAPIIGNKKMWGPRIEQGIDTLVSHAMNGYGLMPAKGGNDALTETEIRLAIGYMMSQVQTN